MRTILAFDTTTQSCSVGLQHDGQIFERFEYAPRRHSDLLLPMINAVLAEAQISPKAVDAIAITQGPGSFMGTRLVVGVAQGLSYAWDCPITVSSTLQLLAQTGYRLHAVDQALTVWDARMNEVYWGGYKFDEGVGVMQMQQPDQLVHPEMVPTLDAFQLIGNMDIPAYDARIACNPHAVDLLPLAVLKLDRNEVEAALSVVPIYLRRAVV
jgi:tRNA threonylcarbamoyladenosine biosynthesis protein TsaB